MEGSGLGSGLGLPGVPRRGDLACQWHPGDTRQGRVCVCVCVCFTGERAGSMTPSAPSGGLTRTAAIALGARRFPRLTECNFAAAHLPVQGVGSRRSTPAPRSCWASSPGAAGSGRWRPRTCSCCGRAIAQRYGTRRRPAGQDGTGREVWGHWPRTRKLTLASLRCLLLHSAQHCASARACVFLTTSLCLCVF